MTTAAELLTKQKIVEVMQRMPEGASIDDAIERLQLLKAVAAGLQDVEDGLVHDHDAVFAELLNDDAPPPNSLEQSGEARPARTAKAHRDHGAKGRTRVRAKTKESSR
jgi:predicted transcriptional regulator